MAKGIARARGARIAVAGASLIAASSLALPGLAQQQPKAPAAAPKAGAAAQPAQGAPQSAWVKLCEKAQYQKVGADGKPMVTPDNKPVLEDKQLCLTHHEQMTSAGVTIVSAAIQQLDGVDKLGMMVMVPCAVGLMLPAGMKVIVYNKEQWEKAAKKEKVDENQLISQNLIFTSAHEKGCTAENEATPQLVEAMKTGAALVAVVLQVTGRPMPFEVPLTGFAQTISGAPVDNEVYKGQREKLAQQIRANQLEQMKKFQEALQQQTGAPAAGGPAPGAKAPAPAAAPAAPAKK